MQNPDKFCKKGEIVMDIKTFAVFPDKRFKYGGIVYIGSPDVGRKQIQEFVKNDSFASYAKNKKLSKCFDCTKFITAMNNSGGKEVYMVVYRFYPPFLWSKKKIMKALEESFDECKIG